jgi:hypothetical protein
MFAMKEIKRQNRGFAPLSKKQTSLDRAGSTKQIDNLPGSTHFLQRNLGNSYLQSITESPQTLGQHNPQNGVSMTKQNFSRAGFSSCCPVKRRGEISKIQTKLTIGPAEDIYEQEADYVAEQIMQMPDSSIQPHSDQPHQRINVRRISAHGGVAFGSDQDIKINQSGGRPLSSATRSFMEPRLGVDFGHVRLHTDHDAHQTASQIQARAFTYGHHIWLGKEESEQNKKLLAHELTHVMQQSTRLNTPAVQHKISPMIQRAVSFSINNPLKIDHWTPGTTTRSGARWRIGYGDFKIDADIHAEADDPAEFTNWEVGLLQTERIEWNRRYWRRPNDGQGQFLERKLRIPAAPLTDHINNTIVWYAPSTFASISTLAAGGASTDISLTTTDIPSSTMPVNASDRSGDVSDGTDNSYQFRAGINWVQYVSAHNSATDEWRHLELIYRSAQAAVDFQSDPVAAVVIRNDNRTLGQSRRFRWSRAADQPAIGATLANDYVNDPSNWTLNRVEGWT